MGRKRLFRRRRPVHWGNELAWEDMKVVSCGVVAAHDRVGEVGSGIRMWLRGVREGKLPV